jgi:hypothetical protein
MDIVNKYVQSNQVDSQTYPIFFSQNENLNYVEKKNGRRIFKWGVDSNWVHYPKCTISGVKRKDGKIRVIVRHLEELTAYYDKERQVLQKYMLGFDIGQIGDLEEDIIDVPVDNLINFTPERRPRWKMQLDEDYCIWQYQVEGMSIENSELAAIRQKLMDIEKKPYDPLKSNIFGIDTANEMNLLQITIT